MSPPGRVHRSVARVESTMNGNSAIAAAPIRREAIINDFTNQVAPIGQRQRAAPQPLGRGGGKRLRIQERRQERIDAGDHATKEQVAARLDGAAKGRKSFGRDNGRSSDLPAPPGSVASGE